MVNKLYGAALQKHLDKQIRDWADYHQVTLDLIDEIHSYKLAKERELASEQLHNRLQLKRWQDKVLGDKLFRIYRVGMGTLLGASVSATIALFSRPQYIPTAFSLGGLTGLSIAALTNCGCRTTKEEAK